MVKTKWEVALAVAAGAMAIVTPNVLAQGAPVPGPISDEVRRAMTPDRPKTIQQLGLTEVVASLSAAQQQEINRIVDVYLAEEQQQNEKNPMVLGSKASREAVAARLEPRAKLNRAIGQVLDEQQRKAWQAALLARAQPLPGANPAAAPPRR